MSGCKLQAVLSLGLGRQESHGNITQASTLLWVRATDEVLLVRACVCCRNSR